MSYLPPGTTMADIEGRTQGDEESILEAFAADVRDALESVPGVTEPMVEYAIDYLQEEYGADVIERRRIDPRYEEV